ncbi:hypothetical protein [Streptomyces sp. MMBL 11-3]
MPSSRATLVTIRPEEATSAITPRLTCSKYRFEYSLPTWHCFL